jgi:chorismate-pyruvate lyase
MHLIQNSALPLAAASSLIEEESLHFGEKFQIQTSPFSLGKWL